MILFDLDSTLLNTYGEQEGEDFNYHYSAHDYHPLLCYDGLTGNLLKAEHREGSVYSSNGAVAFMQPLLDVYLQLYPVTALCVATVDYAVVYDEFYYQAGSWEYPRRVVIKVEKPYNQFNYLYSFIVTNMDLSPEDIIRFYCNRGTMENFIKESKNGFDFASTSSRSKIVNANCLQFHVLAYNLFNWFKRMVLPTSMRKMQIDTIRLKLFKIASRVIRSARYITFKLCSSCPYQKEFYETFQNIRLLPKPK